MNYTKRRFVALVLAMLMVLSGMPLAVRAAEVELEMDVESEVELVTDVETAVDIDADFELDEAFPGVLFDETVGDMEAFVDAVPMSSSPFPTPPPTTIPDRQLTPAELELWIANYHARGGMHEFELEVVQHVNAVRATYGLPPFTVSPIIMIAARFKAQSLYDLNYWAHAHPVYGFFTNMPNLLFNVDIWQENLAMNHPTPQEVVTGPTGWMTSTTGHRNVILNPNTTNIGIGFFNNRWAMMTSINDTTHIPVPVPEVTVTSVTVTPGGVSLNQGGNQTFAAIVAGNNFPSQAVTWTVEGSTNPGTSISAAGVLTVAVNEAAASLTVRATSVVDSGFSGVASVGVVAAVTSWEGLRAAVNAAPAGVETVIQIHSSFVTHPPGGNGNAIVISANRHITLVSSNTAEGVNNVRTLTQNIRDRHFTVNANSSLTLCQNITLRADTVDNLLNKGGIQVNSGGELIMNPGSIIENIRQNQTAPVVLSGSGTGDSTQARFTMNGGVIQNSSGLHAGGVHVGANSRFIMGGSSEISYNTAISVNRSAGGVNVSHYNTAVFEMSGNATISKNTDTNGSWSEIGGGVNVQGGTFIMRGGNIVDNSNIEVQLGFGNFVMYDGTITRTNSLGSGVVLNWGASFIMNGGEISNHSSSGVRINFAGTMTMNYGEIRGNEAGGISLNNPNSVLTMYGGKITENISTGTTGAGVDVFDGTFTMAGGTISNNIQNGFGGGGVRVNRGVFNVTSVDALIKNNQAPVGSGGGIYLSTNTNASIVISAGVITGNSASGGGGVRVSSRNVSAFTMTGGSITNNIATHNGGGVYTVQASHITIIPDTAFNNLNIGPNVIFYGNTAGNGPSAPPENYHILTHIASHNATIWGHPLNNHDINYTGRLGQEHGVSTWEGLRAAVNNAPANRPTTIYILNSFEAPTGAVGNAIVIPANRDITIISSNTASGAANVRVLTQENNLQRHFIVHGSLTLGRNITLRLGASSGGVQVVGGTFVMGDGSDIVGW